MYGGDYESAYIETVNTPKRKVIAVERASYRIASKPEKNPG